MNRPARLLILALVIIATGCLTVGCTQGANVKKALASASAEGSASDSAQQSSPPATSRPVFSPTRPPASPRTPATIQHTVTASPTPATAAASPPATPSPSQATGGAASSMLWLWILLGVLLIAIVVIVITRRSRRRSAFTASWRSQAADASAKGAALHDAVSLDVSQGRWQSAGAEARWVDIQRRADDLTQQLYRLRDSGPSDEDRLRVADVLASLQAVRSAMDGIHTPGGASAQQSAPMSYLLQSFGESLRALRSPDVYQP
jgi:hypothetical protein